MSRENRQKILLLKIGFPHILSLAGDESFFYDFKVYLFYFS